MTTLNDVIGWLERTAEGANKPVEEAILESESAEDLAFHLKRAGDS